MSVIESASYFMTRPRESQIAALGIAPEPPAACPRPAGKKQVTAEGQVRQGVEIPMPDFWGLPGLARTHRVLAG